MPKQDSAAAAAAVATVPLGVTTAGEHSINTKAAETAAKSVLTSRCSSSVYVYDSTMA